MFKPVPVGNRTRYSYARINEVLPMPHLIDIQRKSYEWFMREGLCEIFHDISPIKDFTGNLELCPVFPLCRNSGTFYPLQTPGSIYCS